jgi:hypothetical protein
MISKVSSYHQEEMMEKKDQTHFIIIGVIHIFLPHNLVEANKGVADGETTEG